MRERANGAEERTPSAAGPAAPRAVGDRAQGELLELLRARDPRLGQTYEGALHALANEANPDCLSQAAHSIRELFDALPAAVQLQRTKTATLGEKVAWIAGIWSKEVPRTAAVAAGWVGSIDDPLRRALQALADFFRWFEEEHPRHSIERDMALDQFDPGRLQLPEPLRKERGRTFNDLYKYMNAVAHHNIAPSRKDFTEKLAQAEAFLRTLVKPTPLADRKTMDEILKGGSS